MDLLTRNNLEHIDNTYEGTRKIIVYFSFQIMSDIDTSEKEMEKMFIDAMINFNRAITSKLDDIILDNL